MKQGLVKLSRKNVLPIYSFIHILFWSTYGLMFSFASMFLLNRGFTNSQIGIALACAYGLSALMQPVHAALFGRFRVSLNRGMLCIYSAVAILSLCLLVLPMPNWLAVIVMVAAFSLHSSTQPSVNSLAHAFAAMDLPVNFGFTRALGSVGFAVATSIMGTIMNHLSPTLLPAFYLGTVVLMILTLLSFDTPPCGEAEKKQDEKRRSFARENPRFMLLIFGLLLICFNHELINTFMLQVMQNIGGGSQELGIAVSLAAMAEVPVMMLYTRIRKKLRLHHVLLLCGWAWFVKNLITAFAPTPAVVYGAQAMQALGYAVYVPMMVQLVEKMLPKEDYLKGLSLAGSFYTSGGVFAAVASGVLIDALGVSTTLRFMLLFSLTGAALFTYVAMYLRKKA